jgi:poly(hydroxyalkanoate) granule-associated protein
MADPKIFERLWGQALVAVTQAEEEATKAVQRIAEAAGSGQDEVKRQVRELSDRLVRQRKDLEHSVEEGVRRTLARLRVPRREEVQDIQARLDRVAARIDALARR